MKIVKSRNIGGIAVWQLGGLDSGFFVRRSSRTPRCRHQEAESRIEIGKKPVPRSAEEPVGRVPVSATRLSAGNSNQRRASKSAVRGGAGAARAPGTVHRADLVGVRQVARERGGGGGGTAAPGTGSPSA